jgi:hypothetical protein
LSLPYASPAYALPPLLFWFKIYRWWMLCRPYCFGGRFTAVVASPVDAWPSITMLIDMNAYFAV